ncbi:MAG TPA: hypothetical protein G4O14_01035 [Anaerolineae bacterium]|nr:hypothetical protein [Anaerolineae bacterium]
MIRDQAASHSSRRRYPHPPSDFRSHLKAASTATSILVTAFVLSACVTTAPPPTSTPTLALPTATPTFIIPTLVPTATFTPEPESSPTPDLLTGLGDLIFEDSFDSNLGWDVGQTEIGGASLVEERLSLAVRRSNSFYFIQSPAPTITDFFLEVTVRSEVCSDGDEFGVMFRYRAMGEHYRFALTCDERARVSRVLEEGEIVLVPLTQTYAVFPGLLVDNRIAIWASGNQFRFFINHLEVFSASDRVLPSGKLTFFVRSRGSSQTTVSFDDFTVYALLLTPTPTEPPGSP